MKATSFMASRAAITAVLLATMLACGGATGAFAPRYPDNLEPELNELVARAKAGAQRTVPAVSVGISERGNLFAYDLAGKRVLWEVPSKSRFSPLLAGNVVVVQEGERVYGFDLKLGAPRFQFDAGGMQLVGADGVGDRTVIALTLGQGTFARSRVVFMRGGTRAWEHGLEAPVGVPALSGDVVLVPWSSQYLTGLDAESGVEFARLRVRKGVISHAFVSRGQVYVGSLNGIALLSPALLQGNLTSGPHYEPPQDELPGRPGFLPDAYSTTPIAAPSSAKNRVRLAWQSDLRSDGTLGMAGDNLYLTFYRFVFALDPRTLELHWVHTHDVDIVGARAQLDGVVLADSRGAFTYLSASGGAPLWREQNGPAAQVLEFPTEQVAVGAATVSNLTAVDVRKQLAAAAQDTDSRLVPVRMLAVQLLAKLQDPMATQDLLALCEDDLTTVGIRKAACNALRQRSVGNEHVLRALERHGSYLAATNAPPVGALAKAATTQNEKRAAPLLIAHLNDPNTPTQGLAELVQALGELGDATAGKPLAQFLLLYHADSVDDHLGRALAQAPDALVRLQGEAARPVLSLVAGDPLSVDGARAAATKALAKLDELAKTGVAPETEAAPAATTETASTEAPKAPAHITVDIIKQVLLPVYDPLQACIRAAKPDVFQARVVLVIEDGQLLMVSVTPEQVQSCIEPLVRTQTFPLTQLSQRERITYMLKRF
ncbi:MAG: hypothetical protein RL701_6986 [Pseudomonadota bacterium]